MNSALVRTSALAIASALVVFGCRDSASGDDGLIAPDTYVAVMAELADLRRFPPDGSDPADRDARADSVRADILRAHGITAADLLAFAERVGPDPERMEALAEQIAGIADSLASLRDSAVAAVDGDVADTATSGRNGVRASEFTGSPVEIGEGAQKRSLREQLDSMRATRRRPSP